LHLNRRARLARPIAEAAVAAMEIERVCLVAMLLFVGTLNAPADNAVYDNITRHPRGDDVLQADIDYCSQMLGAPQSGTPTPHAYKSCMRRRGWRYSHAVRERATHRVARIFEACGQRFRARRRATTTMHENARRLEWSRRPGAKIEGVVRSP
jgi:hypothetical protein